PAKALINKAANGTKAWVTSLTTNYRNNELSYLYSPCFDLHTLSQPVLSFSHIFDIEDGCPCDYTWIEYSDDGGVTWNRLGNNGSGINWYNDPTGLSTWRTSITTWHVASVDLPTTGASVRFRFVMSSDAGYNLEGVGIDDIHVFDKAAIYTGPQLLNTIQTVSGSNWIDFSAGGKRIASINPNGQNLGLTNVDVYPYSGPVRFNSEQYYLDRNIVVRPTIQPTGDVTVRFYFTDAEAKNLISASGCPSCNPTHDPYELGVTKYDGTILQENGTLNDNYPGVYNYILPANTLIIPYDNGYYAEFTVSSFSEFWLNNGGFSGQNPLPLSLLSFEAIKQNKRSLLLWSTDNEVNLNKFIVERSADGRSYRAIGETIANNRSGINNYTLTDNQPFAGINFYRLKMADRDGSFKYSPIRKINFASDADDISIYPNPVLRDGSVNIISSGNCNQAVIYDAMGKEVRVYKLNGRTNAINLSGIARGMYQLKVFTENSVETKKILIQ
ncbi:MAG TPA: T9SS type A sorting domain-containing protein, partial [Ferruginibacter sp.]|nr:T9SS type A sorting domain-containing protein [Ferruginibacter sp.]